VLLFAVADEQGHGNIELRVSMTATKKNQKTGASSPSPASYHPAKVFRSEFLVPPGLGLT